MELSMKSVFYAILSLIIIPIITNIIQQIFFPNRKQPPVVFHWVPKIGSTVDYGQDPYAFFFKCREKYGDCFTFGLLGMKVTVYLGPAGNNFILNGKHKDLSAEEVYGPLTIPIFGPGVVYDVDNARFMEQKRLLKEGFSTGNLRSFIQQFVHETEQFLATNSAFRGSGGVMDISAIFSELSLYTAAGSLQGKEVRNLFDSTFATLYRHLDDGFAPINFMFPWLPIPVNRRRDHAQKAMANLYLDIIGKRRATGTYKTTPDMISALMDETYKDGTPITDSEIANLMIALLMGGQHNTAASGTWIMLHLAHRPHLIEELHNEQLTILGPDRTLTFDLLPSLTLHNNVIKETLRLHSPIHSIMRKVKTPLPVPGTDLVVPKNYILLAAPGVPSRMHEFFPDPLRWDPHRWDASTSTSTSSSTSTSTTTTTTTSAPSFQTPPAASTPNTTPIPTPTPTATSPPTAAENPYLPFGAGRHRCIGESFAYAQLTGILATLVRELTWEQVELGKEVPRTDYSSMFSRPVAPSEVRWRWRDGRMK